MRTILIVTLATLFVFASATHAQKIVVDVDKTVDITQFRTYGWSSRQVAPSAVTSQAIIAAVERELNARGLVRTDSISRGRVFTRIERRSCFGKCRCRGCRNENKS